MLRIIRQAGHQHADDRVNHAPAHAFEFGRQLVKAHLHIVGGQHAKQDAVEEQVYRCGDRLRGERCERLDVPSDMERRRRPQVDHATEPNQVEHVVAASHECGDRAVDQIVPVSTHEQQHGNERKHFECDAADGDVLVFLHGLEKPFHSEGQQQRADEEHAHKRSEPMQPRDERDGQCEACQYRQRADGDDGEQFPNHGRQFSWIITRTSAFTYAISWYADQAERRQPLRDVLSKGDVAVTFHGKCPGDVWNGDDAD